MEALVDGRPGPNETWEELAEHSFTHDDLPASLTAEVTEP